MIKKIKEKFKDNKAAKKTFTKAVFYFFIAIFVFYFAKNTMTPKEDTSYIQKDPEVIVVKVQKVQAMKVKGSIILNGQTSAKSSIPLKARTGGRVEKIVKQKGEFVKEGEVILTLSQDDRSARLSAAKAKIREAEFRYQTTKELVDQKFESPITLTKEKASLQAAQAELKSIQQDIDYTSVKAPFDGIFDTKNVEEGDVVTPATELGIFVSLNPILIQSHLPEKYFGKIKQSEFVKAEFLNDFYTIGTVTYISNLLDPRTRTFLVEVEIPNDDLSIGIGQTAKLTFSLEQKEGYKLKNQSLLTLNSTGDIGVKVVEEGKVKFLPIEIIKSDSEGLWVEGLYDDAQVITLGGEYVDEGQKVKTQEEVVENE